MGEGGKGKGGGTNGNNRLERAIQLVDVGEDVFEALFAGSAKEPIARGGAPGEGGCIPWRFPR